MTSVIIICPNARRCTVKVSPGKLMQEEVCLRQGYDANTHVLNHQKRKLDLALPFRLTGLPNNANLELIQQELGSEANVEIALQLPSSRFLSSFSVSKSLSDVLEHFSAEAHENLLSTVDGKVPLVVCMNKQYKGIDELKFTTLKCLGVSGYLRIEMSEEEQSVMRSTIQNRIKAKDELTAEFEKKNAELLERQRLDEQRMKEFAEYTREQDELRAQQEAAQQPMEVDTPAQSQPQPQPSNRLDRLQHMLHDFMPNSEKRQVSTTTADIDDNFFEVNVQDVKKMQESLRAAVVQEQQRALLPKAYIDEKNRNLKLVAWPHCIIRVVLSDGSVLQGRFYSAEPSQRVLDWVGSLLPKNVRFIITLPLNTPYDASNKKNLVDIGVAPCCTLYAKLKDGREVLTALTISTCDEEAADAQSKEWLSKNSVYSPFVATVGEEAKTPLLRRPAGPADGPAVKRGPTLPKWLKR